MEIEERVTAELWLEFGGLGCSEERARARRSELATGARCGRVSGERESGRREWTRPLRPGRRRGGHAREEN